MCYFQKDKNSGYRGGEEQEMREQWKERTKRTRP